MGHDVIATSSARTTLLAVAFGAALTLAHAPNARAQETDALRWSITPYVWAPTTTIDLAYRGTNIGGQVISVGDVLDKIDVAFMINVEYGKGNWSAFADLTYMNASDAVARTITTIDTEFEQVLLDAGMAYWPAGVGTSFNVVAGMRYTGSDNRFSFSLAQDGTPVGSIQSSSDYYDGLLGLRYRSDFSERWSLLTRGDVSFGDTERTFLLQMNFAYTVGKEQQNRIMFGYQYREAELMDGDLTTDIALSGPMAGFNVRF